VNVDIVLEWELLGTLLKRNCAPKVKPPLSGSSRCILRLMLTVGPFNTAEVNSERKREERKSETL
jgi:hypothetical protein